MKPSLVRALVAALFFISGAAALVYQVAWQRLLVIFAGGDVYSTTIIVTAFMLGLGGGSLVGGLVADRFTAGRNLVIFAAAEALIGLFGFASKFLYYDLLYERLGVLAASRSLTAVVLIVVLFLPTFLMGVSLPLLARAMTSRLEDCAARIGTLYAVNTAGAALGALAATWALLPLYGLEGALRTAAFLNVGCALLVVPAILASKKAVPAETATTKDGGPPKPETNATPAEGGRLGGYLLMYAIAGFAALALEMVWFRLLGVMLKSTAFTFGTLLAVYLAGIGTGAWAGGWLARRSTRPGNLFLLLQGAAGIYAGLSLALLLLGLEKWAALEPLRRYLDSYEPVDANTAVLLVKGWLAGTNNAAENGLAWLFPVTHLGLPLVLMGPATFLMGLAFPCLQKAVHTEAGQVGRRVGWLQAANIGGCVLGTVVLGFVALPLLGTAASMKALFLIGAGFVLAALPPLLPPRRSHARMAAAVTAVFITGVLHASLPGHDLLWARVHGTTPDRIISAEDGAGVSVLKKPATPNDPTMVYVNGIGQSWLPFGGIHSALGALPAILHPNPVDVAVIGLGSGDTLYSVAGRAETQSVVCVEIIGAQKETLRRYAAANAYPALTDLLKDPRMEWITGDGRRWLMRTQRRFDVIEADALRPTSAHAGNLYSEAYFRLLASRLKPGGIAITWSPTQRVHDTFVRVFPHVLSFGHLVVGSNDPIVVPPGALQARVESAHVREYYQKAGIPMPQLLVPYFGKGAQIAWLGNDHDRSKLVDINTDVFPKDEFELPALWGAGVKNAPPSAAMPESPSDQVNEPRVSQR